MAEPSKESLEKMWKYVKGFAEKSGTSMHPNPAVTNAVVLGLAAHYRSTNWASPLPLQLLSGQTSRSQVAALDVCLRRNADL